MRHSFLKMVAIALAALGFIACGDDKANKADNVKQQALQSLEKLCDEGVSYICLKFAKKYKGDDEVKRLAYLEKGCNGKSEYGEKYIGESCYEIAEIYAKKLEGDKAKKYYAKACEMFGSGYSCDRLKDLDESLYVASKDLYDSRKREEAEKQNARREQLEQNKSQEEPTQTCESDDNACKCENGDGEACNSLGEMYRKKSDKKQAMDYHQKGCEYGNDKSCLSLGYMYKEKLDGKQALAYLQKGCEYGNHNACWSLRNIEKDTQKVIAILKAICDKGVGLACLTLGTEYGFSNDYKQAMTSHIKACELGVVARDKPFSRDIGCVEMKRVYNHKIHRGEILKYLPNFCKTKGGESCDLLWSIGNY